MIDLSHMPRSLLPRFAAVVGVALTALLVIAQPARADIWGYVDEHGVAHLSDSQVNTRYFLFKKEAPRPVIEAYVAPPLPVTFTSGTTLANRPFIVISPAIRAQFAPLIARVASEFKLDASLIHAIVTVESGYNPQAKSPAGAIGLMQLMPGTAARFGVTDIWDPLQNLQGGARYLRVLLGMFNNNLDLVLAAYNAGEGAVMQAGNKIPNYAETKNYVPSVLTQYERYRSPNAATLGITPAPGPREQPKLIR